MRAKDAFFQNMAKRGRWLTFGDVRLRTGYSSTMPKEVLLESQFSRNVPLNMPIVSAAMDTVTERKMAIQMALMGGLGVIHRGLSPEEQAHEVARVKFHLNGLIEKPICVSADDTIQSILARRDEKGWSFHSFPVIDSDGRLVGLLTETDFLFCRDNSEKAKDVMTTEIVTCPPGTTIDEAYVLMCQVKKKVLPLVDKDGCVAGLYIFNDLHRIKTGSARGSNVDERGQLRVGAAIGTGEQALERAELLIRKKADVLIIDTSHGDSEPVYKTLRALKREFPQTDVVVGNVSEAESALRLAKCGADGIKVGQGPGSICTTRIIAGVGAPQVTAIYNCSQAVEEYGIPVCADGGIRYSGDIVIAIASGAHSVMLGNLLAGTDEAPGKMIFDQGRQWKEYRGMGSQAALQEYQTSRERYRQVGSEDSPLIPEGIEGRVPYRGPVRGILAQYLGGLRQGMGYVGAASIEELREKANFILYTPAGHFESHPHGLEMTEEAPNYIRERG